MGVRVGVWCAGVVYRYYMCARVRARGCMCARALCAYMSALCSLSLRSVVSSACVDIVSWRVPGLSANLHPRARPAQTVRMASDQGDDRRAWGVPHLPGHARAHHARGPGLRGQQTTGLHHAAAEGNLWSTWVTCTGMCSSLIIAEHSRALATQDLSRPSSSEAFRRHIADGLRAVKVLALSRAAMMFIVWKVLQMA